MVKLLTLSNNQLKDLLRENELDTLGNKNEMVDRLIRYYGTDEVDKSTIDRLAPITSSSFQDQLNGLKEMMQALVQTVGQLSNPPPNETTNEATPPPPTNSSNEENQNEEDQHGTDIEDEESIENVDAQSVLEGSNAGWQAPRHYSVKEIGDTIPEFDPTKDTSLSVEQFVQHVEGAKTAYGWDDKALLLAVYGRLKGVARMWFDCRPNLFTNWSKFKSEIVNEFGTSFDEAEICFKMSKATRRTDEKIIDYCFRINTLGKRFNLSESAIIRYAREGLKHRELQNSTAAMKFVSMKQFRETITEYFANMPSSSARQPGNVSFRAEKRDQPTAQKTVNNEIRCYNCNAKGHISKNCTHPQKRDRCATCQRTTHKTSECPTRSANITMKKPDVNTIADSEDTYNDVVKQIDINGKTITAFLDSGSPKSLIRETCANQFNELTLNCFKKLTGFAGGSYVITKKIPTMVRIDDETDNIELYVVNDADIPEDVLIGRDLLCKKGNRLIIENGNCRLESTNATMVANINEQVHNEEIQNILKEKRKCIAENLKELGKCTVEKMKIELTTDVPVCMKPYRIPFAKRAIVSEIIQELLDCGIIRPSISHYASPVVLVAKKNGEHRLCVDYRCLNKITKRLPFPIPNLEEQFAQLSGNSYFTTLDLRMGYHQIMMDEESKAKTAFITPDGHFEYNCMSFGLVNAPSVFQRIMNKIASEMSPGEVLVYLDDVIIPSTTIEEGLQRLRKFLDLLIKYNLTLRIDKCRFLASEIEYLGHIVNKHGIQPGKNKITAIKNFKTPQNVTEVRRFLGLTGFFRKFVPYYSIIAKPITKLLSKAEANNFDWTHEQQNAFEHMISLLCEAPVLALYDINKQHEVHTDACVIGLAGVLLQSDDGKNWQPVIYFSRHCTKAEQVYHSFELEVLAVVESLERFRLYLLGKPFRIKTDCSAIAQTKDQRELKPRIARWWLKMQEYDFEVVHRPGNRLAHVDALSRAPVETVEPCEVAGAVYSLNDQQSDWVVAMQQRDERAKHIIRVLNGEEKSPEEKSIKRDYEIDNGRLYYKTSSGRKFYVPKAVRWSLINHYHDDMGHFATEKTLQRLKKWFWFPKMRKLIKNYVGSCISCCYNKSQRTKQEGELHFDEPTPLPFRVLHIDHLGPFIRSCKGNMYLIVITDAFSKFCILKAVKDTKTGPVINLLKEVISYFGLPDKVISDRGTAFTSKLFNKFCQTNNIQHVKTAVRTPRANGQVERTNATVIDAIRTTQTDPKRWDEQLMQLQWVLNSQPNSTTRFTPNELVFNYDVNDVVQNSLVAAMSTINEEQPTITAVEKRQLALTNIMNERHKWKLRFDKAHAKPTTYCEGDLVVIRHEPAATGQSRKLEPKFRGPYCISRSLGNDRYVIKDVPGLQLKNKAFNSVYSTDNLKPWCQDYPEILPTDDEADYSDDDEIDSSDEVDDQLDHSVGSSERQE